MPFPIDISARQVGIPFTIEDPFGLRKQVFSILTINVQSGIAQGLGTSFLIGSAGILLTAEHVLTEQIQAHRNGSSPDIPCVFVMPGLVFGQVRVDQKFFPPIRRSIGAPSFGPQQFEVGAATAETQILDVLRLEVDFSAIPNMLAVPRLELELNSSATSIGDTVVVVGFPKFKCEWQSVGNRIVDGMTGAIGIVRGKHPTGRGQTFPTPVLEIEGHFKSGMSGGPVFNQSGKVIGLLSSSFEPSEYGCGMGFAVDFSSMPSFKNFVQPIPRLTTTMHIPGHQNN